VLCDIFMLCDSAQVADDKLFALGAGWQHLRSTSLPFSFPFGLAIGLLVTADELDEEHLFRAELKSDASGVTPWAIDGTFRQSMKAGEREQDPVRLLMAANINVVFEDAGSYSIRLSVDGTELATTAFQVIALERTASTNAS